MDSDMLKEFCEEVKYLDRKRVEWLVYHYGLIPLTVLAACILVFVYPDSTYAEVIAFTLVGITYHTGLELFPDDIFSNIDDIVSHVHEISYRKWVQCIVEKYKIKCGLL